MLKLVPCLRTYDDGSGVCRCLENNLCSIYEKRPLVCNIEAMYMYFFKATITEEQFIIENLKACRILAESFHDIKAFEKISVLLKERYPAVVMDICQ
jgi:Fe-S-cluster containining protein